MENIEFVVLVAAVAFASLYLWIGAPAVEGLLVSCGQTRIDWKAVAGSGWLLVCSVALSIVGTVCVLLMGAESPAAASWLVAGYMGFLTARMAPIARKHQPEG